MINKDNIGEEIDKDSYIEKWNTKGGNTTEDKVFLLSIDEAKQYFDSNEQRSAFITKYAEEQGKRVYIGFLELYIEFIENREKIMRGNGGIG